MATEKAPPQNGPGRTGMGARRAKSGPIIDLEAEAAPSERQGMTETNPPNEKSSSEMENENQEAPSEEADAAAAEEPTKMDNSSPKPAPSQYGVVAVAGAGIIGGLIVLGLGYGLQTSGILPAPGRVEANLALAEADRLARTISGLDQRLTMIEAASAQTIADRALLDDLSRQMGVVDAFGTSLSDRLLNIEASVATLGEELGSDDDAATQELLDSIVERIERLETAPSPSVITEVPITSVARPDSKDPIETEIAAPAAAPDIPAVIPPTASQSEPADITDAAITETDPEVFSELAALAKKTIPSVATLTAEFPEIAEAMLAAQKAPDSDAGLFDRVLSYGNDLVKIRREEPTPADDPAAIVARMRVAVEEGDLAAALDQRRALPPTSQQVSRQWADAAADRLAIDRLLDGIANAPNAGGESGQAISQ